MKTYIKFLTLIFFKSFIFVSVILLSLIFILNLLTELEFFKNIEVTTYYPMFISLLNTPSLLFEMLPFVFLLTTQVFFVNLLNNNQIQIFKYSGLNNDRPYEDAISILLASPLCFPECDTWFSTFFYFLVILRELFDKGTLIDPYPSIPISSPV